MSLERITLLAAALAGARRNPKALAALRKNATSLISCNGSEGLAASIMIGFIASASGGAPVGAHQRAACARLIDFLDGDEHEDELDAWAEENCQVLDDFSGAFLNGEQLAIVALGHLGTAGHATLIRRLERTGGADSSRMLAVEALSAWPSREGIEATARALGAPCDNEWVIRDSALYALEKLPSDLRKTVMPTVVRVLADLPDHAWRANVAARLGVA